MNRQPFDAEDASTDPAGADLADVARVSSLAEAGYLTSVLAAEGVRAELRHARTFNALSGAWFNDYVLQTPRDQVSEAAEILQAEAEAADAEDAAEPDPASLAEMFASLPIALVAVAGIVGFVTGQQWGATPARQAPQTLAEAVDRIGMPFYAEARPGAPRHRLLYDRSADRWLLDTDQTGDGRYDRRNAFSVGAEPIRKQNAAAPR